MPIENGPRFFAILGMMRTGSNYLERSLGTHPDIAIFGEAFNPGFIGGPRKTTLAGWDVAHRDANPLGLVDALIASRPHKLIGFRIFNGHDARALEHCLTDPACARIVLRRDPVESYVSLKIARETDQWMLSNPQKRLVARVTFDAAEFDAYRARIDRHYAMIETAMARHGQAALWIDYADLRDAGTMPRVLRHLGVAEMALTASIHRQNPEPLSRKVVNFAEMCGHLGHIPGDAVAAGPGAQATPVISRQLPLMHLAQPGARQATARVLMHWLEKRECGADARSTAELVADTSEIFEYGERDDHRALSFTFVRPVVERLYALFLEQALPGPAALPHVREALVSAFGETGSPGAYRNGLTDPVNLALHRDRFLRFLEAVVDAREGRGPHPVHLGWDRIGPIPGVDVVLRGRHIHADAEVLTTRLGVRPVPGLILERIAGLDLERWPDPYDLLTPSVREPIERLYAEDVERFGF